MKVATLGLDSTVHSHFFTPKTSSGTRICISCLTGVWHDRRQPSFAWRRVKCDSSVGSISPPPSTTTHLHCAQVPPPPQAEDRNTLFAARVCSSLPPAGTVRLCSPLIWMVTSPLDTSLARATRMIATRPRTMAVNMPMARKISNPITGLSLQLHAGERHEAQRHQADGDEGDPQALQALGDVAVL